VLPIDSCFSVLPVDSCFSVLSVDSCFTVYYPLTLVSQCTTRWLLFHSVLSVDSCFTLYYPLTLVSQYTTRWLLFHSVLPVDSCFTVYYPLTLVSQCTTRWLLFQWSSPIKPIKCVGLHQSWSTSKHTLLVYIKAFIHRFVDLFKVNLFSTIWLRHGSLHLKQQSHICLAYLLCAICIIYEIHTDPKWIYTILVHCRSI
jgi:hypothetical protein